MELLRDPATQDDSDDDDDLEEICNLVKESHEASEAGLDASSKTKGNNPMDLLGSTDTQDGITIANHLEEIYNSIQEVFKLVNDGIGETKDAGPKEKPRVATQEDVTTNDT